MANKPYFSEGSQKAIDIESEATRMLAVPVRGAPLRLAHPLDPSRITPSTARDPVQPLPKSHDLANLIFMARYACEARHALGAVARTAPHPFLYTALERSYKLPAAPHPHTISTGMFPTFLSRCPSWALS